MQDIYIKRLSDRVMKLVAEAEGLSPKEKAETLILLNEKILKLQRAAIISASVSRMRA